MEGYLSSLKMNVKTNTPLRAYGVRGVSVVDGVQLVCGLPAALIWCPRHLTAVAGLLPAAITVKQS